MKKILYISNVDLEGAAIPGVVEKIKGQRSAFLRNGFDISLLYLSANSKIVIEKADGTKVRYDGGRSVTQRNGIIHKVKSHLELSLFGSINFNKCYTDILRSGYDVIYLRFYIPGRDLLLFLRRIKKDSPDILITFEYPTLNVGQVMKSDYARRFSYLLNKRRIDKINALADYIITLSPDKELFGKPAVHMSNGYNFDNIKLATPYFERDSFIILGVASDCAACHGFDRVISGMADYYKIGGGVNVIFRIITNLNGHYIGYLRKLIQDSSLEEFVKLESALPKEKLLEEYCKVNMACGSLSQNRIGLKEHYPLKHREYAAAGLPFVASFGDRDFDDSPFVYFVEADDSPVQIDKLFDFYQNLQRNNPDFPTDFRKSMIEKLSWDTQLKPLFSVISSRSLV